MTTQDIVKGLDLTRLASVGAADINQAIDNAYFAIDKGIIIESTDSALNTPSVPDAVTTTKFARYLWRRIPHATAEDLTPIYYYWDAAATSDATYLKWNNLLGLLDIDLTNLSATNITSGTIASARFGSRTIPWTALKYTSLIQPFLQTKQYTDSNAIVADALRTADEPWINCKAYGALGDGVGTTVAQWITDGHYGDLAAIQDDYPWVKALTDTIDYVCIQDALNRAWDLMIERFNTTTKLTSDCAIPNVYLPAGIYKINRSLIIPPHCNFFGDGPGNTIIKYAKDGNEILWSYMTKTSILPAVAPFDGFYAALVVMHGVSYTRDYVTTGVDTKHNITMEDAPLSDSLLAQDASIRDLRIILEQTYTVGIYSQVANKYEFNNLYIQNETQGGLNTDYTYGIICSKLGGAGYLQNCKIINCTFNLLSCAVFLDRAKYGFGFFNNEIINCYYGLYTTVAAQFLITGNKFIGTLATKASCGHINIAGYLGLISNNVFANFNQAIELSGAGLLIEDNSFAYESTLRSAAFADGFCLKVLTESAHARISGMELAEILKVTNTINILGNILNYTTTTVAVIPFYLVNTATESIQGYAEGNGFVGNGETAEPTIFKIVEDGLESFKLMTDKMVVSSAMPAKYPAYTGQLFNQSEYNSAGYADFKVKDQVYVGESGKVAIGAAEIKVGITYEVFSFAGTGTITYNSIVYSHGQTFVGITGFTTYSTVVGDAKVYKHKNHFWNPVSFQDRSPVYSPATVTTAAKTLSRDISLTEKELTGIVVITFDNSDVDKEVFLPAPDVGLKGKEFTLIVVRPVIAPNPKSLTIKVVGSIEALVPKIHWYPYSADVVPWTLASTLPNVCNIIYLTGSGAGPSKDSTDAIRFCSKFLCDGTYWYQL